MTDNNDTDSPNPKDQGSAADEWADALNEQNASEPADRDTSAEDAWGDALAEQGEAESGSAEDAWGDALAEQDAASSDSGPAGTGGVAQDTPADTGDIFKPLGDEAAGGAPRDLDMIMEIPVTLSVELGRTRLTIRELLDLSQGSIIELDGLAGEPMDIQINGYLIAQGEVVVVDDRYGIRITDIITPSERIHKLNNR